jgi:hypothetical protein
MPSLINFDLGSIINGASGLVNSIGNQIRGKVPVDEIELAKLELQMGQLVNAKTEIIAKVDEAQALINLEDAKSGSFFQRGWRPTTAWICLFGILNNLIIMPTVVWFLQFFTDKVPPVLALDTSELMTLLFGLLGLGAMRSYERIQKKS